MAYPDYTSGSIMDRAASLNNDPSKSIYTYTKQVPFLNSALQELQEFFELNNIPVTDTISAAVNVLAGTSALSFSSSPALPADLVEPKQLWERVHNINPYTPMTKRDELPRYMEGVLISQFQFYVWQAQEIRFLPANIAIDIKMDYIRNLFSQITAVDGLDTLSIINGRTFLEYRTGALVAQLLGENPTRAKECNDDAGLALDRILGIGTKGRQSINTRRRPFRSTYKRRQNV